MLSRTANGLFWMSRYVERMENIARLLDAGRRMEALPQSQPAKATEWASIVIASGCQTTFQGDLDTADQQQVCRHLILDIDNPSSIKKCVTSARENARAMRSALTTEVWDAINQFWAEMKRLDTEDILGRGLPDFLERVKSRGALVRGAIETTLLRDDGYSFIEMGKLFERADATARLLDVKYHVLLPRSDSVGGGLDYLQWVQVLRAANAATAYRHVYKHTVDAKGVIDLLAINTKSPRSLAFCISGVAEHLAGIGAHTDLQRDVLGAALGMRDRVRNGKVDAIVAFGLHEWLTEFIISVNSLAENVGTAYGLDGAVVQQTGNPPQQ